MTTALLFSTPNHGHQMIAGHQYMSSYSPSNMDDSYLQKMIFSTPRNIEVSTPITPTSTTHMSESKYVNMGTIGEGSYGLVLKCKERQTGRIVAIKKFIESEEDKSVRKIAMREIHLLKQLRHENLVNLLEVFRRKRRLYLVFEFVEKSLLDHLELSPRGLERSQSRRILYQVIRALEFCHIHNIIHRDVKPENILISKHGVVKLCDFGFARTLAKPGEIYTEYVSTRWYRAPELLVGDARYGRAVDIWALGCLSAEMLTGQPLFPGDSDIDQLFSIVKCFGGLCRRHEDRLYSNPMFRFEISQIEVTEPLKCRLRGSTSREFQFVSSCLELDPHDRPTCSNLMNHPLFTCDGFNSWFPEELDNMLKRDAVEHKLLPQTLKPKRLLPDINKCLQINTSTPIKGANNPFNSFNQTSPFPPQSTHNNINNIMCDTHNNNKCESTHRNLNKAFGNCAVVTDSHDDVESASQDVSGLLPFDLDLMTSSMTSPHKCKDTSSHELNTSSTQLMDMSFSNLSIKDGVELEGEESPNKLMNIKESYCDVDDDDDDDEGVKGVHARKFYPSDYEEDDNYNRDDNYSDNYDSNYYSSPTRDADKHQHPVSQKKSYNNYNKKKNNNKIQSTLPMSSSSSSSSSSSLPMKILALASSSSSSSSTSGVSSPTSSSSSSSTCLMRSFNKNNYNANKHYTNNNNNTHYNNNNNNTLYNNNNNNTHHNHNHSSNKISNIQSQRSPCSTMPLRNQNQKMNQQPLKNNKSDQRQQHNNNNNNKPLQPQKIHPYQQQYQANFKQVENESPKPVQRNTQQQQNNYKQQQNVQNNYKQQQHFNSKAGKKKSNVDVSCRQNQQTTKPVAKQQRQQYHQLQTPNKIMGQPKIGLRNL